MWQSLAKTVFDIVLHFILTILTAVEPAYMVLSMTSITNFYLRYTIAMKTKFYIITQLICILMKFWKSIFSIISCSTTKNRSLVGCISMIKISLMMVIFVLFCGSFLFHPNMRMSNIFCCLQVKHIVDFCVVFTLVDCCAE